MSAHKAQREPICWEYMSENDFSVKVWAYSMKRDEMRASTKFLVLPRSVGPKQYGRDGDDEKDVLVGFNGL